METKEKKKRDVITDDLKKAYAKFILACYYLLDSILFPNESVTGRLLVYCVVCEVTEGARNYGNTSPGLGIRSPLSDETDAMLHHVLNSALPSEYDIYDYDCGIEHYISMAGHPHRAGEDVFKSKAWAALEKWFFEDIMSSLKDPKCIWWSDSDGDKQMHYAIERRDETVAYAAECLREIAPTPELQLNLIIRLCRRIFSRSHRGVNGFHPYISM